MGDISKDCIEWSGSLNHKGYARASVKGSTHFIHRVMFGMTYGFYPPVVMHTCDNRKCIRPSHLKAGTHQLNVKDRDAKGRGFKKLSDADIASIVKIGRTQTYRKTAAQFGVEYTRIYQIVKNGGRSVIR